MKFSICIPNFNYAQYLGLTLRSVLDQSDDNFEVLVSDNASTDSSVDVVTSFQDPRVHLRINDFNVGFAGNLDRVAGMASGDRLIMLSSDDLMGTDALVTYRRFLDALPDRGQRAIVASAEYLIDSKGTVTDTLPVLKPRMVLPEDRVPELDEHAGAPVYRVEGKELLRRCALAMGNPFHFATTSYPRGLYDAVGGYSARRIINPDKWFHWKLLAVADAAYFIDRPLFHYRWHTSNQDSQLKKSGALKYLVDEYLSTIEIPEATLKDIGLARADVERAFVEFDIARHGWAVLARDSAYEARRIYHFSRGVYPQHTRRNLKAQLLRFAAMFGILGQWLARGLFRVAAKHYGIRVERTSIPAETRTPVSSSGAL